MAPDNPSAPRGQVRFSVRDLAAGPDGAPLDEWRLAGAVGLARARLGTLAHTSLLTEAALASDYQKEQNVRGEFDLDGYRIEVFGRVDGLRQTPDGLVVEELKTTHLSADQLQSHRPSHAHQEQCLFYCTLLEDRGLPVIGGVVLYYSLLDGSSIRCPVRYEHASARALLLERIRQKLAQLVEAKRSVTAREALAANLGFAYGTMRAGQQTMVEQVEEAARGGMVLAVSAPTGIGKTAAALFPMLVLALAQDRRLFFCTARVSQQVLAVNTLRASLPDEESLVAVQLEAKERSCPMQEIRCVPGVCPYLTDFGKRWEQSGIVDQVVVDGVADADTIREQALEYRLCPFEVSMQLARRATVLVCDLNYIFDPRSVLTKLTDEPSRPRPLLVVDEAHNLSERVMQSYSPRIHLGMLAEIAQRAGQAAPYASDDDIIVRAGRLLDAVLERLQSALLEMAEETPSTYYVEAVPRDVWELIDEQVDELLPELMATIAAGRSPFGISGPLTERAGGTARLGSRDPLLSILLELREFGRLDRLGHEELQVVWYPSEDAVQLHCLSAARFIRESSERFRSVLFMSATLTPFDFFLDSLGRSSHDTLTLELPSPFPPGNRRLLLYPEMDTTLRERSAYAPDIAACIDAVTELRPGNYLAFFQSFVFRDEVLRHLRRPATEVLVQSPRMPTEPVLNKLRANKKGTLLLTAVQGGVFAEGVDFLGELCHGVFVVGPGIPRVSVERELRRTLFSQQGSDGYLRAYVQPGMIRSVQAGGRVIRSPTDRGFVLLLGRRFALEKYVAQMPAYWRNELSVTQDPVAAVADFWGGQGSGGAPKQGPDFE